MYFLFQVAFVSAPSTLSPRQGFLRGASALLQMMGGNSNSPLEASLVKNKLCCVPSVPLKNPFHDLVQ